MRRTRRGALSHVNLLFRGSQLDPLGASDLKYAARLGLWVECERLGRLSALPAGYRHVQMNNNGVWGLLSVGFSACVFTVSQACASFCTSLKPPQSPDMQSPPE